MALYFNNIVVSTVTTFNAWHKILQFLQKSKKEKQVSL